MGGRQQDCAVIAELPATIMTVSELGPPVKPCQEYSACLLKLAAIVVQGNPPQEDNPQNPQ